MRPTAYMFSLLQTLVVPYINPAKQSPWVQTSHIPGRHRFTQKQRTAVEELPWTVSRKTLWAGCLNHFSSHETSPLSLKQLQSTNICSDRVGILNLIRETSQWNIYNHKHCDKTKPKGSVAIWSQNTRKTQTWPPWAPTDIDRMGMVGWSEGVVYLTSLGRSRWRTTDIGLQLGKACYPCSR